MAGPPRRARGQAVWWAVGVLLAIPIVMPLVVPIYAREEPTILGFPFFYWYQFAWIAAAASLTSIAYHLTTRQERRDREARDRGRGGTAR